MGKQETHSVSMVKEYCAYSDYMEESNISCNDKTVSWDGDIIYFREGKPKAVGNEHQIPIQIKGKYYNNLPEGRFIKYPVKVRDLRNFLYNRGILLIVVAFNDDQYPPLRKMFAKVLLPVDIKQKINNRNKQKTITLREVKNYIKLEVLCQFFIENWPKQSILVNNDKTPDLSDINEIRVSGIGLTENAINPIVALIKAPQRYLYVMRDGMELPIVASNLIVSNIQEVEVFVGDICKEDFHLERAFEQNKTTLNLNKIITLIYQENTPQVKVKIKVDRDIALSMAYPAAKVIIACLSSNNEISICGVPVFKKGIKLNGKFNDKELYQFIIDISEVCIDLGIDLELLSVGEVIKAQKTLRSLHYCIVNEQPASLDVLETSGLFYQSIDGKKMLLAYEKTDNGKYIFHNFLGNNDTAIAIVSECNGEMVQISNWFAILPEILPKALINRKKLLTDLTQLNHPLEILSNYITNFVLAMIEDFDRTHNVASLSFANSLVSILLSKEPSNEVNTINSCQIKYRMGTLSENDEKQIMAMKINDDSRVVACACILLKQTTEFEINFSKFTPEQQHEFEKWPIYNLYMKMPDKSSKELPL